MKVGIDTEVASAEVVVEFHLWRKPEWEWQISRHGDSVSGITPIGYFYLAAAAWKRDHPDQPKYSRPKTVSLNIDYGQVKGYKE